MTRIGFDDVHSILIVHGKDAPATERYAAGQVGAFFRDTLSIQPVVCEESHLTQPWPADKNLFLVGTLASCKRIGSLVSQNAVDIPQKPEGFTLQRLSHPAKKDGWVVIAAGSDSVGCLWAVRDLCHYHLIAQGEPHYDGQGCGFKDVFGRCSLELSDAFAVCDWPRIMHRAWWAYDREFNITPPIPQGYILENPARWIDNMSRWKANLLLAWEAEGYLLSQFPDLIEYAHLRGVKIVIGMGFYSYYASVAAPPHLKRTPTFHKIPDGQFWCTDRGLCPSDPENQAWQIERALNLLRRFKVDGIFFQTGEVDYKPCDCPVCQKIPGEELFVRTTQPIIDAIRSEFGRDFWIIANQFNRPQYHDHFKKMDPNITFLWESSCFPVENGWSNDPASRPEEGRRVLSVRPGNSGYEFRFYMAGMGTAWLDRRRWAVNELRKWSKVAVESRASLLAGLFQTQLPSRGEYDLPATYSEIAWNPERSDEEFATVQRRIRDLTTSDPVRTHLLSDPPQIETGSCNQIILTKHLCGLHRPDPIEQFHGIRGQVIGDILESDMMGDVLFDDSDPAVYTFQISPLPRRATLTLRGCLDDLALENNYRLDVFLNEKNIGPFDISTWPHGVSRGRNGFTNTAPWTVELTPPPQGIWTLRLKLCAPDGWIFIEQMSVNLSL